MKTNNALMETLATGVTCAIGRPFTIEESLAAPLLITDAITGSVSCGGCGESADDSAEIIHRVCCSYAGGGGCNGYP
jgi:hypothetical protein